jgi:hypothetical protein
MTDAEVESMLINLALEKGNDPKAMTQWLLDLPHNTRVRIFTFIADANDREGFYPAWLVEVNRIKRDVHGVDIFVPKNPELWKDYWNKPGSAPQGYVEPLPRPAVNT